MKGATAHWWHQRLTAIALVPLALPLAWLLPCMARIGHDELLAWMHPPLLPALVALLLAAGLYHMKLGVEAVIGDYVHRPAARWTAQIALVLATWVLAALGLVSILVLAAGGAPRGPLP